MPMAAPGVKGSKEKGAPDWEERSAQIVPNAMVSRKGTDEWAGQRPSLDISTASQFDRKASCADVACHAGAREPLEKVRPVAAPTRLRRAETRLSTSPQAPTHADARSG